MKNTFIRVLVASTFLSGCSTVGLNFDNQTMEQPEIIQPFSQEEKYWLAFEDPLMDVLASDLLGQNLDVKIALIRIDEARALRRISRSSLFPDLSLSGIANRGNEQSVKTESLAQGGLDTSWELDLFGANRAGVNASEARLEQTKLGTQNIRRIVIADLIRAIIEWRQANQTLSETQSLLEAQGEQVNLFQSLAEGGLIDSTFLERARAQREQTATQIPLAMASAKAAQYQIERLMGQNSESLSDTLLDYSKTSLNVPKPDATLNAPIETIRNRADIRASAYNLIAAQADLEQAEANLWPKISLSGFFGVKDASDGLDFITASNPIWSIAGNITAPLINFGRLRGAVVASNARANRAALEYENAVLNALQEAQTALSDYLNGVNAVNQQASALKHRKDTVSLERERFNRGLTNMIDLTTAQAELNQATILLIDRKTATAIAFVRLQKAIGI